jgi:hypothetical protein
MNNQNENLVKISKKIIRNLDLKTYITHAKLYKNNSSQKISINEVKKEALKLASNDFESTYLFIDRVLKQINLLLIK